LKSASSEITQQIQDTLQWFARDALVHLSCPRGLEQANGGAWGVRDVCQGPVEFLLSYGHRAMVADILRRLFASTIFRARRLAAVVHVPAVSVDPVEPLSRRRADLAAEGAVRLLEDANDASILHERLPYTDEETFEPTEYAETVLAHVDRLITKMRRDFLPGIALPRYGDGDWDDSLQPADPVLRERMVSS